MIEAIQTSYKSYRFRSRLEARWAVFLDRIGVRWEYEKEGYNLGAAGYYLPDFWLPDFGVFLEIKGEECSEADAIKCRALFNESDKPVFIAQGQIGDHTWGMIGTENYREPTPHDADQSEIITAMLGLDSEAIDPWGVHLRCPVCNDEYVHFGSPELKESDNYTAWKGRGNAICIPMYCESGHAWSFRIGFHKGFSFMGLEGVQGEKLVDPGFMWAGRDSERYANAIAAARSARFEHGEVPA